ncbi:centrosomal protein of 131 kDa-like isoform X2 [Lethenteron reissneri]|uniref:centrosomal protein of 131 kDa-like isoform X2 n=1 Tax=Lethenteron reissneri TaxID=7753 RepID=UPI002AB7214D|nr:centrosomal protein of 131 kDa-like isoform X2 [Lethenteron reissneri]
MRFFKRRQQLQATLETPNSSTVELEMPEKEMHQLSQEVSTLRGNLGRARAHFATLRGALSQRDKSLHEMLRQLNNNHAEELRAHSQAINSLQVELEAVRWGEREEQLRREHDTTLHLACMELAEYRASHMHADSEYDAHVVHITVLQKELKERDELLRHSEADLVAAREVARERGTEAERLGTEAAELRVNMHDLFTNQEVQQTEVDTLRHEALELQQRLQEANACCEETGNSLEQQMDFLKAELGVSRAEEAARVQEVVQLQHTLQHTDAEMDCMHGQIARLQHQLRAHSQAINSLHVELKAVRWGERQEQLRREHDTTLHLACMELAEYRASHMHADSEYDAHVVHITVLQKELKERNELLRYSEADLVAAREVARERGTEAERLGTEAAELRVNMHDLFTNQEVQQTEVDTLRHEALELQQRLQEANACCEETGNSLEQQMDFLKAELGVSRAEEAARVQEVVQLQHTLQHTDAEMDCMHGQIARLQHQLRAHSQAINSLHVELKAVRWGERQEQLRREHDTTLHLACMELAEYRASHMHADSEYDAHVVHITVLQKELKERNELLRYSEADLVAAREVARERGTEAERLGTEAAELRVNMHDLFTNQEVQQTEVDTLRHEALELQQRLQEANACCEETGNSLEQQMDFLKAELGVSRAEEALRLKELEGHVQTLGSEKAQQQDTHRKEACELATGLEEVRLTLADAFKQFERNSKKVPTRKGTRGEATIGTEEGRHGGEMLTTSPVCRRL